MSKLVPVPPKTSRMVWLDCLRLTAGVSMVGLHASSDLNGLPFPDFSALERAGPVIFRTFVYIARTELFLIISLFLLCLALDRRPRPYHRVILQQIRRLLVPFGFWVVFYAFYRLIKAQNLGYEDAIWAQLSSPQSWAGYFLLGDVQYHMHFLPTLFGLVIFYPFFQIAIKRPELALLVFLCLMFKREVDVWLWANFQDAPGFSYMVRFVKILTYCGYGFVAAGLYGLYRMGLSPAVQTQAFRLAVGAGFVLATIKLVHAWRVIQFGNFQYNFTPAYWADFLFPAVLFLAAMALAQKNWPGVFSTYAPYSFGIYLVHPVFLDLAEIFFRSLLEIPVLFVLAKAGFALTMATIATIGLEKSKVLGWTVGLGNIPFFETSKFGSAVVQSPVIKPTNF